MPTTFSSGERYTVQEGYYSEGEIEIPEASSIKATSVTLAKTGSMSSGYNNNSYGSNIYVNRSASYTWAQLQNATADDIIIVAGSFTSSYSTDFADSGPYYYADPGSCSFTYTITDTGIDINATLVYVGKTWGDQSRYSTTAFSYSIYVVK